MMDDWGLDPFSFRLWFHYRRWCGDHGTYNKPVRQTAALIDISPAQVTRARQKLLDQELIRMNPDGSVSVTDIWDLNREWFVSGRNKSVSVRNKSVSDRNKMFLIETSPYKEPSRKNLLEDTTTTKGEGGGGGGHRPDSNQDIEEKPLSVYTLAEVTEWAEQEPGILMPDRFAKRRWLDGSADSRIAAYRAKRDTLVPTAQPRPAGPQPLSDELLDENVNYLVYLLEEGSSIDDLEQRFAGQFVPEQWQVVRTAVLEGYQRRAGG